MAGGTKSKTLVKSVKELFVETTVHGFRYLVESRYLLDKLLWLVAITVSFTYCTFFIITSIKEAEENPVSSYVDVVSVKEAPRPAITVFPPDKKKKEWASYRFVTTVMNAIEWECGNFSDSPDEYDECLAGTSPFREAVKPMVLKTIELVEDFWKREENEAGRHSYRKDFMFDGGDVRYSFLGDLNQNLCYWNVTQPGGFDETQLLEVRQTLADSFQVRNGTILEATSKAIKKLYKKTHGKEFPSIVDCVADSMRLQSEYESVLDAVLMLNFASDFTLGFGNLLEFARLMDTTGPAAFDVIGDLQTDGITQLPDEALAELIKDGFNINDLLVFYENVGIKPASNDFGGWNTDGLEPICKIEPDGMQNTYTSERANTTCLAERINDNIASMLKGYKYLYQAVTHKIYKDTPYYDDLKNALKLANYPLSCDIEKETCYNSDAIIRHCHKTSLDHQEEEFYDDSLEDCSDFRATFGQHGLQYTFKQAPFLEMYSDNAYNLAFFDEVHNNGPKQGSSTNDDASSRLLADFHVYPAALKLYANRELHPYLAIHHDWQLPTTRISLLSGFVYTITVTPSMITTDEDLVDVSEEKRACRFMHEGPKEQSNSTFRKYSQTTCVLECKLRKVYESMKCIPFDYPHFESPLELCEGPDNEKFSADFDQVDEDSCDCPTDCNIYNYDIMIDKKPFKDGECPMPPACHPLLQFLSRQRRGEEVYYNEEVNTQDEKRLCLEICRDLPTRVIVKMKSGSIVHTKRVRKTTFADQLATFGGILGLFTGMSVLSVFEFIMWIKKTIGLCVMGGKVQDAEKGSK